MNGSLTFQSEKGLGTTFTCRLPAEKIKTANHMPVQKGWSEPGNNESLGGCRVLAVEDDRVLAALIMRQLGMLGIRADLAVNGTEALEKLRTHHFDLVLMDINLPDFDGYQVTREIRRGESPHSAAKVTIVAMTAGALSGDRERALEAGMNDYLAKPVRIGQLKESLAHWLRNVDGNKLSRAPAQTAQTIAEGN
jgi:CheY-like chemotaxis protein